MKPACDVCGQTGARPLSAEELAAWWWLARWIAVICLDCRRRFRRSEERYAVKAAA